MKDKETTHLLLCECHSPEHQAIFTYFPQEDDVIMTVHLKPDSFWKRIVGGIKYIFGHRSMYGDFDEFIFNPDDWEKVQDVANHLKVAYEQRKN